MSNTSIIVAATLGLGLGILISRNQSSKSSQSQPSSPPTTTTTTTTTNTTNYNYQNQVVVVTGSANGIGAGVARAFHASGAHVWCADVDTINGNKLAQELGERLHFRTCDCSNVQSIQTFITEIKLYHDNQINVLINNVGVQLDDGTPAHLLDETIWNKVIAINLSSYFLFSKYCLPSLMSSSTSSTTSSIINMSSVQGLQSQPGIPAYAASKGGILSMTRQMSMDYAGKGVRINAINPGTIRTPLFENLLLKRNGMNGLNQALKEAAKVYPIQRIGEISEIASVCLFLASEQASFVTGESITVDGGIMAKGGWCDAA